jgi:hypothetical protein
MPVATSRRCFGGFCCYALPCRPLSDTLCCIYNGQDLSGHRQQRTADVHGGGAIQKGVEVARIEDHCERRTREDPAGHRSSLTNCRGSRGKVSISMPKRAEGHKQRTLSLISTPLASTSTITAERSVYINGREGWRYSPSSIPSSSLPVMQGS